MWDFMVGRLLFTLAHSSLGAIITRAVLTEDGAHLAAAESGDLLYWSLRSRYIKMMSDDIESDSHDG